MEKEEQKISGFVVLSSTMVYVFYVLVLHILKRLLYPSLLPHGCSRVAFYILLLRVAVCVCVCPPITICHLSKRRRQTPRSEAESAPHRFSTCFSPAGRKRVTRRRLNLKRTTTRRSVPCARTWSKIQPCLSRPGRVCVCVCVLLLFSIERFERKTKEEERRKEERESVLKTFVQSKKRQR